MFLNSLLLLYTFFKIGLFGFGGGYAMISMILAECENLGITLQQFADLLALDMVVPGPIAINAATYVGYLANAQKYGFGAGVIGSLMATIGVALPSLILVSLVLRFIEKYRQNSIMTDVLSGVKAAAVGFIVAAAINIGIAVVLQDAGFAALIANPLGTIAFIPLGIFAAVAVANIRFKVNPILLTLLAGVIGAVFIQ
ncbi:MAG: chromate transporter [Christensenellaceae bacterium]|jgi:chromate transporter|nr:chromate transporter [Christensenellaceae bacterium]